MNFLSTYKVEFKRLLKDRLTWLAMLLTTLSPLAGYGLYRPLLSTSQTSYMTTSLGAYLANPALAGAIGGAFVFALLTVAQLDKVHRTGTSVLTDTIISPLQGNAARIMAVISAAFIAQVVTVLLYVPFTFIETGNVFDGELYLSVYFAFMFPAMLFAILFSASAYQVTHRADLSLCLFVAFVFLSLTAWSKSYLLCWVNPAVWILSDDFGNSRLLRTVMYNRLFWSSALLGLFLFSFLCVRRYKKNIFSSFILNGKKLYIPIMILGLIGGSVYIYSNQPFLDHSLEVPKYSDNYKDSFVCTSAHLEAMPDIKNGRYYGLATYNIDNLLGKKDKVTFMINPGYKVSSIKANGVEVPFVDMADDNENAKSVVVSLPSDKKIQLNIAFGGIPREWNILEKNQGTLEIGKNYVYIANQAFAPELEICLSDELEGYSKEPFQCTSNVTLPQKLTPVLFGTGTTKLIGINTDGTKNWELVYKRRSTILYAADFVSEKVDTAGLKIDFFYSAKHKGIMEKAQAGKTLKNVFEYCTAHYGPLKFYKNGKLKLIQVTAFQGGGFAGGGSSVMDESCFNERSLKDSLKGAGGSEVLAHEIVHQWWGLGNMFSSENPTDEWSSEGLTVYTTYRLMKELYGEQYAKVNYIDVWQREVDEYYNNFYIRHPEYLKCLPEKYQKTINNDLSRVRQYCVMPLKIVKAEKLVGGESKMDEILSNIFNEEKNPEKPYLEYKDFLGACKLTKEDLELE